MAASTLLDFVPENVAISWGGVAITGFAPDTFITTRRNSANTTSAVGADGSVGITKNADKTGEIEISLMQTSDSHIWLAGVQALQDYGDLQRANMTVADASGGYFLRATNVHIMEPPEISLGADQNTKTWKFYAEQLQYTEFPEGFAEKAGAASRVADAIDAIVDVSGQLNDAIGA